MPPDRSQDRVDVPVPAGFPPGFASGDQAREASLVLASLRGITPRTLHDLAWSVGTAQGCLEAVRDGLAGSDNDQTFALRADPGQIAERVEQVGSRFVDPRRR